MAEPGVTIRMVFADEGSYHHEDISLPGATLDRYDRLIDCLREDPEVLRTVYVDLDRLVAAYRLAPGD